MQTIPSQRALAVARGLVRTGRAADPQPEQGFLRLQSDGEGCYWISFDGNHLLRGEQREDADELQPGFIEAMVRAGTTT